MLSRHQQKNSLPQLSSNPLEWIEQARPTLDGKKRTFLHTPFWEEIYKDDHAIKMILGGRQTYKSTYLSDMIACSATSNPGSQIVYVTFDQPSLNGFSKQRLQIGTFGQNPILSKYPRHRLGNIGEISLKNGSTIYCTTDNYEYKHVEGKSPALCVLDEAQYQDIQYFPKVLQTMMATHGKIIITGIGAESGSPYEALWKQTDQMQWEYYNEDWRERLQFDNHGLVVGDYLLDALKGHWVARAPNNLLYRGYHMPQSIFASIPLTIHDADTKYKVNSMFSIEYQKKYTSESFFVKHSLGMFAMALRRPVTREVVLACMEPYRHISLLTPAEVLDVKNTYGEKVTVAMGVDWGSGPASSKTVVCILLHFRSVDRYMIARIEARPQEHQLDQAKYMTDLFFTYNCDIGVADLGYGADKVKIMQDGGADRTTGRLFPGIGSDKFLGCRSMSNISKPHQYHAAKTDEHGDTINMISVDKTAMVQDFIDMLDTMIPHPRYPQIPEMSVRQLMIPYEKDWETDWLINDFTSITRKDLTQMEDDNFIDSRISPKKEFNHPRDSIMAIIYAKQAAAHLVSSRWDWA